MVDILKSSTEPAHPIKVVATRTGLSKDVIRVWERRYRAISPARADTGRRLYTDADIDRLLQLKKATAMGWRISDVAQLPQGELDKLLDAELQGQQQGLQPGPAVALSSETGGSYLQRCILAIEELNPWKLDSLLASASVAMSVPRLLDELVAPLLATIGERWHKGELRVGHEHMASSVIRRFLDNLRETASIHADGPTILITTPSGQNHEMGAMMAAVVAAVEGWKAIYLMPNMPARDIAAMALQAGARALALSITYPPDDPLIASELRFLQRNIPEGVALFVGGQAAASYAAVLEEIGAHHLTSFVDIIEPLRCMRSAGGA
jgi:DNA-binding transcriptional MerR regulator/methylmalonyl-CoA mutase cobalamin-binding subunit